MFRRMVLQVVALILCSLPAAFAQNAPAKQAERVLGEPNARAAAALLAMRIKSVDWDERTFAEVIDWLSEVGGHRINVVPRWRALATEGVGPESLITLKLVETTVANVLNEVLSELSLDDALNYQADRNFLRISTRRHLSPQMYARAYYVGDIVRPISDFWDTVPATDLAQMSRVGRYASDPFDYRTGRTPWPAYGGGDVPPQFPIDELGALMMLIQTTVEPDSWRTGPGRGEGWIDSLGRTLIVYNTIEVHLQIAGYFDYDE